IRTALSTKLQLPMETIDKIIPIENTFQATMATIRSTANLTDKEREKQISSAHVTRRAGHMAIPISGRQMEDVIILVETIRRKHKL
ncbi:MAG TPA: hypothetical protein VMR70_20125, partial [Flavisolibacter sp.]|nr:hypothetical protein [Flavisolibacter sp.]